MYAGLRSFLVGYWEAMYLPAPPEDSEAELALLRDARLAVIPSDWGHYASSRHDSSSAHCSGRRSMCGTGAVSGSGRLPLPSCVTLVVRRLARRGSSQIVRSHQLVVKTSEGKAAKMALKTLLAH